MMDTPAVSAMLLAAGRGERMRPLTDTCPKPLLAVQGKPLLQWPMEALARQAAATSLVINTAWLGAQIEDWFGSQFAGLPIHYSHEGRDFGAALETAGGIARALPLLGPVFWVLAGDVYAPDFVFDPADVQRFAQSDMLAHLWLVPNPAHNPAGDFGLEPAAPAAAGQPPAWGRAHNTPKDGPPTPAPLARYTYSTIGLFRSALFSPPFCSLPAGNPQGAHGALAPVLRAAMDQGRVSAALYTGRWTDVGTPERLAQLNTTAAHPPHPEQYTP